MEDEENRAPSYIVGGDGRRLRRYYTVPRLVRRLGVWSFGYPCPFNFRSKDGYLEVGKRMTAKEVCRPDEEVLDAVDTAVEEAKKHYNAMCVERQKVYAEVAARGKRIKAVDWR